MMQDRARHPATCSWLPPRSGAGRSLCAQLLLVVGLLLGATQATAAARAFGAPMPEGDAVALAGLLQAASVPGSDEEPALEVKVSGNVTEVCQKKGCWMVLADGADYARVVVPGHAWELPKDARGRAVVHGLLRRATV